MMSPRSLLTGSAAGLGGLGVACLFFPEEMAAVAGLGKTADLPVQLFAAGLLAIAVLNWMGRGAIYGGIYGRPIVVANFGFGLITAASLSSALMDGRFASWGWGLAAVFGIHALIFFRLMRSPPWRNGASDSDP